MCAFLVPVVVWYTRFLFPLVNSIFPWIVRPPAKLDAREIDLFMRAKLTRRVSKKTIKRRRLDGGWAIDILSPLSFILLWDSFHSRSDAPLTNTGFGGEEINWFCMASVNNDWQWRTCLSAAALFMKENAFICRCLQTLAPQNKRLSRALWVILSPADCVYMHRHTLLQTITVERDTHTGNDCRLTQEVMSRVRLGLSDSLMTLFYVHNISNDMFLCPSLAAYVGNISSAHVKADPHYVSVEIPIMHCSEK